MARKCTEIRQKIHSPAEGGIMKTKPRKAGNEVKEYQVYIEIQELKGKGFSKSACAEQLQINRRTVDRYWEMSVDEYEKQHENIKRSAVLDKYREQIISWLKEYPTMSASQVCDWLKEHYSVSVKRRTVSRYVQAVRKEWNLPKRSGKVREYEAVPELPMGKQMQVDFGQKNMKNINGGTTTVHGAVFLLSHSRYKYAEFQSRPFTTTDLIRSCRNCFAYMGGMPEALVFDQDSIVCVSENAGDIVYTAEFEKFRAECRFSVYLCRGADPESKGKIENTVRYVKGNFLENRLYADDDTLNLCCRNWLERTANAEMHGTTKRIPAEVFAREREYLRPLPDLPEMPEPYIVRRVRKDNTVLYDSNRYTVPLGTYSSNPEVRLEVKDGMLHISTTFGDNICAHRISSGRGLLIRNSNHLRDRESPLEELETSMTGLLGSDTAPFFQHLRAEKTRYFRDQCSIIRRSLDLYSKENVCAAISFCMKNNLYSANVVKEYLECYGSTKTPEKPTGIPVDCAEYHVSTQKRDIREYVKAGEIQ